MHSKDRQYKNVISKTDAGVEEAKELFPFQYRHHRNAETLYLVASQVNDTAIRLGRRPIENASVCHAAKLAYLFGDADEFSDYDDLDDSLMDSDEVLNALDKKYKQQDGGKWMLFPSTHQVDATWEKICRGVREGKLLHAIVSVQPSGGVNHLISVYTKTTSENDIKNTLKVLQQLGINIYHNVKYKTNAQSNFGISASKTSRSHLFESSDFKVESNDSLNSLYVSELYQPSAPVKHNLKSDDAKKGAYARAKLRLYSSGATYENVCQQKLVSDPGFQTVIEDNTKRNFVESRKILSTLFLEQQNVEKSVTNESTLEAYCSVRQ